MSAKIIELTAKYQRPTIEDVKRLESFKHYTDEEAAALLQTIQTISGVTLGIALKQQNKAQARIISIPVKQNKAA